jgi:hypothetical protein
MYSCQSFWSQDLLILVCELCECDALEKHNGAYPSGFRMNRGHRLYTLEAFCGSREVREWFQLNHKSNIIKKNYSQVNVV